MLRRIWEGSRGGFKNYGFIAETIQETGEGHVLPIVKRLGCIAPVFTTLVGTASLIKGVLMNQNFENGAVYLGTGLGLLFYSLIHPIIRMFVKKK